MAEEVVQDDPKQKLWKTLRDSEYYTKSYEDFNKQFSTPESVDKLYSTLNSAEYYTKSLDEFKGQFFPSTQTTPSTPEDPLFETGQLEEVAIIQPRTRSPLGFAEQVNNQASNQRQAPFDFARDSNPDLVRSVREQDLNKQLTQSKRLKELQKVYDSEQGQGATEAIISTMNAPEAEQLTTIESTGNSFKNLANRLQGTIPRLNVVSADVWEAVLGKELTKKWYELEGRDINGVRGEAYSELEELQQKVLPTIGIVESLETSDWKATPAILVNAITSLASTAVPTLLTGGAGLVTEMTGESIVDFNTAKAKRLGKTVNQLYEDGQAELGVPAMIGAASAGLEYVGLKGVGNLINKKIQGSLTKKALIYFGESQKEGLTELFQGGLQAANKTIADGGTPEQADEAFVEAIWSKQGLESYLQGVVAAGGIGALANLPKAVTSPQAKITLTEELSKISMAEMELAKPTISDNSRKVLQEQLDTSINKIVDTIEQEESQRESKSPEQVVKEEAKSEKIDELTDVINDPNVSDEVKTTVEEELKTVAQEDTSETKTAVTSTTKLNTTQVTNRQDLIAGKKANFENTPLSDYTDKLYREVRFDDLGQFLEDGSGQRDYYVSDNPELATGQGDNSGVKLTFNSEGIKGFADLSKPGMKQSFESGMGEYQTQGVSPQQFNRSLERIEIAPKPKRSHTKDVRYNRILNKMVESGEWTLETLEDGTKIYEKVSQPSEDLVNDGVDDGVIDPEIIDAEAVLPTEPVTQDKLTEIRDRRAQAFERLKAKLGNINSGINPEALTDLVEIGATYIEEGVVRFKDFAERIKADSGRDFEDKELRDIYKRSAESLGLGVRGFGERVRTDETTPESTAQALDETEQLYKRQDYDEVRERLDQMDDAEKQRLVGSLESVTAQLTSEQNIGVLAGIDLINKYNSEGRSEEASKIVESLSKSATVAAQTLRQYGEFKSSTPDGYIQLVEKWLDKSNKKLTEVQKNKIRELYAEQQALSTRVDEALEKLTEDLTDDNYKEYYASVIAYEDSIRGLEDYIDNIRGKNLPDTLAKILQGNLLSLKSVTINPFANFIQALVRTTENDVATVADAMLGLITNRRTKSGTFTADNIRLGARGVVQGVKRANRKAIRGTADAELSKYDVGGRLKPSVAFRRLYDNIRSSATRQETGYTLGQGLSDFAESTVGVPANIMFRLLPYGDDPFFEQAKTQRLVEIAKRDKGLEGEALEKFVLKPDKKSLEEATNYGKEATFQEDNIISRNINRLINDGAKSIESIGGRNASSVYRLIMRGILPFINTPSSIALKTVKFAVPAIPFVQSVNDLVQLRKAYTRPDSELKEIQIRRAQKNFSEHVGQTVVSGAVLLAASVIVANGLATGDLPEDHFQKKQKDFMFATQPPNTINVSGLQRLLSGDDPTYKQGDKTMSYLPLGLIGAQIGIVNTTQGAALKDKAKKSKVQTTEGLAYYPDTDDNFLSLLGNFTSNLPASVRYFFNQSFVQGAETVLNALATENGAKNILPQLGRTFTSIGIPNTVAQSFRASNDYMRDLYTDDQVETFANIVKEKVGAIEDLPIKYDLWGKPIKQTPEGSNPYVYQIIDIFRTQKILQDPITFAVFDIQRKTGDDTAIPPSVDDSFTRKDFKIKLDKEQKSELTKLVGEERRKLAERILGSYTSGTSDPEKYLERLKKAYTAGAKRASNKFKRKYKIK